MAATGLVLIAVVDCSRFFEVVIVEISIVIASIVMVLANMMSSVAAWHISSLNPSPSSLSVSAVHLAL